MTTPGLARPDENLTLRSVDVFHQTWQLVQTGDPTGGDVTLDLMGVATTGTIAFDAVEADIQAAFDAALAGWIIDGDATAFTAEYHTDFIGYSTPITVATNSLTGGSSPDYTIDEVQAFYGGQQAPAFTVQLGDDTGTAIRQVILRDSGSRIVETQYAVATDGGVSSTPLVLSVALNPDGTICNVAMYLSQPATAGVGYIQQSLTTGFGVQQFIGLIVGQTAVVSEIDDSGGNPLYQILATGDVAWPPNTAGPILTDRSDGHTYRVLSTAGVLSTEIVT